MRSLCTGVRSVPVDLQDSSHLRFSSTTPSTRASSLARVSAIFKRCFCFLSDLFFPAQIFRFICSSWFGSAFALVAIFRFTFLVLVLGFLQLPCPPTNRHDKISEQGRPEHAAEPLLPPPHLFFFTLSTLYFLLSRVLVNSNKG